MTPREQFIDALQTAGIVLNTLVLAYIVIRLERAFNQASVNLRSVLGGQKETLDSLNTVWKRINEIEARVGMKTPNFIEATELEARLAALAKRLDDLERGSGE